MHILFNKIESAFEMSGANTEAHKRYKELTNLHAQLFEKVRKLRIMTQDALRGEIEVEVNNTIVQLEKKLNTMEIKLSDLRKSIGGGY